MAGSAAIRLEEETQNRGSEKAKGCPGIGCTRRTGLPATIPALAPGSELGKTERSGLAAREVHMRARCTCCSMVVYQDSHYEWRERHGVDGKRSAESPGTAALGNCGVKS